MPLEHSWNVIIFVAVAVFGPVARGDAFCPDQWVAYKTSCYLFGFGHFYNFPSAESYCNHRNANLVEINNALENQFLMTFLTQFKARDWWIGLNDKRTEGKWEWVRNNTAMGYSNWSPGEPESRGHTIQEDCVMLHHEFSYEWHDMPCGHTLEAICESTIDEGLITVFGKK